MCCTDEACHCKISLWCWCSYTEEATHHCAWEYTELLCKHSDASNMWSTDEEGFKKCPTIIWYTSKINCKLTKYEPLSMVSSIGHESTSQLSPSICNTHIY